MKLTLHRHDLRPEFEDISFYEASFEHFNENAQRAIIAAGYAVFWPHNQSNEMRIFVPKSKKQNQEE